MSTTTFTVTFTCDNVAFEGENRDAEIVQILHRVASGIRQYGWSLGGVVCDTNGKRIGSYGLEEVE